MAFAQRLVSASARKFTAVSGAALADVENIPFQARKNTFVRAEPTPQPIAINEHTAWPKITALQFSVPREARGRATEFQRHQQAMVAHVNQSLSPESKLVAGSILPPEAFHHDLGRFVMLACDVYACSPVNTYLSPTTQQAADYLGLPFIPAHLPDDLRANALSKLQWLRESVMIEHRRTSVALQQGDMSYVLKSSERQRAYAGEVAVLIHDLAIARCGTTVWQAHEHHFRAVIQGC